MKDSNAIDLTMLEKYAEKWVALSSDESKVLGSGESPKQALEESIKKGEKNPILTKVPKSYSTYIL